uniref:Uncharacterized protein LOC102805911 n=1 Tax=Saccoglossus kowalevskii TaxID=10224 RepID=A0ABM0MS37_SACKO|nr:PREDICTED: uncharacterized protein LOC102805911 [Saccoglossus kowalevskii]
MLDLSHCNMKHTGDIVSVNMQAAAPSCDFNGWIEDVAAKSDGAFTDLPEFHMPDQSKPHDFEDVEIEGKMSGVYCFAPSVGTVQASGTVSPSEPLIKPAMIQCMEAMTSERPYFTVTVTEMGYDSGLAIGITRSGQTVGTLPGYLTETAGYHCHGGVYRGSRHKNAYFKSEEYDKGDIVGCILDYSGEVYIVSFTKNGQLMGRAQVMNNRKYDLLASIGFKNMPSVVRPDWPHKITQPKPIFNQKDLNDWMKSAEVSVQGLQKFKLKNKSRKSEPQMISAPHPLSRECSFFSVKILSRRSKKKGPTIGISNHSHVPRTNSNYLDVSFFTHRNDIIMKSRSRIPSVNHLDIPAGFTNDTIGCGIVYPDPEQTDERVQQFVTVYFTVNGSVVFHEIVEQPHGGLYPTLTTQVYGDELEINTNFKAPSLPEKDAWNEKAFEKIKQHKVLVKALHKETDESRLARPASPVERPPSHLNKLKVYITCDAERWNEATYVKAGLDSYGFNSMLLPQARVAKGSIELDMEPRIKTCQVIVMCITPQYCNSKHAPIELKLAKKYNKPILLAVMEKTEWPPAGNIQDTLQYLTMYRIEMYSDFTWGIEQLEKHLVDVKGKGYNAVEFHVSEGEGARLLYTDAQNASRRNEKTDPNALKKAIADADKRKAQGFGNMDDSSPTRKQANVQRNSKACTIL